MHPELNRRLCAVCGESEPSIIHNVSNNGVIRRLCTDCLLKEHREHFCPVCLNYFVHAPPPPHDRITCRNCPSIAHVPCSPPPSSSFTCPPCSDPNFSYFPKYHLPSSNQIGENGGDGDGSGMRIDVKSAKALIAAANISVVSLNKAVAQLKIEADKKTLEANMAKKKAKEAMGILQDLVRRQNASQNNNPNKRKNSDR